MVYSNEEARFALNDVERGEWNCESMGTRNDLYRTRERDLVFSGAGGR